MRKERLELFSDGVFAIVLTLLVLDLKVPPSHGLAALREAAPGLVVHALTFFVVGVCWVHHHATLAHVQEISGRTLLLNLLYLFWVTLLPYGARIAAEDHWSAFGAFMLAGCSALELLSLFGIIMSAKSSFITLPHMARWRRRRWILLICLAGLGLVCAAASFTSPWFGYLFLLSYGMVFFAEAPADADRRLRRQSEAPSV